MKRNKQNLLKHGVLVLGEDFCLCDIKGYMIKTVVTTDELWDAWFTTILGNLDRNYEKIIL